MLGGPAVWYVLLGKERVGPLSEGGLRVLVQGGLALPETPVWCDGMEAWGTVGEVESQGGAEEAKAVEGTKEPNTAEPPDTAETNGRVKRIPLPRREHLVNQPTDERKRPWTTCTARSARRR